MIGTLLLASGVVFAVLLFALPVFRGLVYRIILSIGFAVLLSGYIQGNFMNGALEELNGEIINWRGLAPQMAFSILLWVCVFVIVFIFMRFAKGVWRGTVVIVPLFLLLIQGVGLVASYDDYVKSGNTSFWAEAEETLTIDGLERPSSDKNAIIFVLDRLDDEFVDMIVEGDPDFFEPLDGFTRFDDNITYAASTFPAVAEMLTGNRYTYDRTMINYLDYAWANADWMYDMKERGVDIRFYMDRGYGYTSAGQMRGLANNLFEDNGYFNKRIALVKLLKLSAFRYAPMPAKETFWISPTEFNDVLQTTDSTNVYLTNDFDFYAKISKNGLMPKESSDAAFIYYHLQGAHGPLNMDENMNWKEETDDDYVSQRVRQSMGCFKILYYYIDQLKALGLYDDATIIITADHPDFLGDELEDPALAALFLKPSGSAGTPLAYSHAPVCPDQLPATIMEGLFGDAGGYGPGYFDIEEGEAVTRRYDVRRYQYEINGDGREFANWRHIGIYDGDAEVGEN
jgi:ABC-type transport system involved in multi-copper enzyme maturation permease subunit